MLTILHDREFSFGTRSEVASAEGAFVTEPSRAVCKLAAALIERGYPASLPVRIVRANPWLWGPPHHVTGVTLGTAAAIDFFAEDADTPAEPAGSPRVRRDSSSAVG